MKLQQLSVLLPILSLTLATASACHDDHHSHDIEPSPTGAVCPEDSTLTYENFAAPFAESYCVRCHSSELVGEERNGAPLFHDFDTKNGIIAVADHVEWYAAAGPTNVNEVMPPDGATPTLEERQQLGEWLACEVGAP